MRMDTLEQHIQLEAYGQLILLMVLPSEAGHSDVQCCQCELNYLKKAQDRLIKEICALTQILPHLSFKS